MADVDQALLEAATAARAHAYAPYSKYKVGAALRTRDGRIFSGCNVENASYGLSNCAERTAVFKAISEGATEFEALALSLSGGGTPCGACRQVLNEFNPALLILIANENGALIHQTSLDALLPHAFGPKNLP